VLTNHITNGIVGLSTKTKGDKTMSNKKKQKKNKKPDKEPKLLTWLTIMNGIVLMLQGLTTLVDKLIELIDHIYKMLS
jgi:hypothetical protein